MTRPLRILPLLLLALSLAGCGEHLATREPLHDAGPKAQFAPSRFDCSVDESGKPTRKPLPPDPQRAGASQDDISSYEDRLAAWGQACRAKLDSVGRELDAAGQVVR